MAGKTNDQGQIYLSEDIPYTETILANSIGHSVQTVNLALQTFRKMGMIEILENDRIALLNWEKHQNIDGMDKVRQLTRERVRRYRQKLLACDASSNVTVTPGNGTELDSDSESEVEKKEVSTPPAPKRKTASVLSINFDFITGLWENIDDALVERWQDMYPATNVERELKKASEWLIANPSKRKKNYRRFLNNWLSRAQERGKG